jgi:hypothetical protein
MLPVSEYEQMAAECQRGERELRIEDGSVMTTSLNRQSRSPLERVAAFSLGPDANDLVENQRSFHSIEV